jgi:hypothetical protein
MVFFDGYRLPHASHALPICVRLVRIASCLPCSAHIYIGLVQISSRLPLCPRMFWSGADRLMPPMRCTCVPLLFWSSGNLAFVSLEGCFGSSIPWTGADCLTPPMLYSQGLDWCGLAHAPMLCPYDLDQCGSAHAPMLSPYDLDQCGSAHASHALLTCCGLMRSGSCIPSSRLCCKLVPTGSYLPCSAPLVWTGANRLTPACPAHVFRLVQIRFPSPMLCLVRPNTCMLSKKQYLLAQHVVPLRLGMFA